MKLTLIAVSAKPARVAQAGVVWLANAMTTCLSARRTRRYLAPDLAVISSEPGRAAALVHSSTTTSVQARYTALGCNHTRVYKDKI